MAVETPQCFSYKHIVSAYEAAQSKNFTDDATVFEAYGRSVQLVDGEPSNIKITTKADLKMAEAILGLDSDDTFV